jgi:hypothetical protein
MMESLKGQTVPILCPFCGQPDHAQFGQSVAGGELRWYRSISCPTSGNLEEDGIGSGPSDLRSELLGAYGTCSVVVEDGGKTRALGTVKRLLELTNEEVAPLLKTYPGVPIGTRAEADWVMGKLGAEGVKAKAQALAGNGG